MADPDLAATASRASDAPATAENSAQTTTADHVNQAQNAVDQAQSAAKHAQAAAAQAGLGYEPSRIYGMVIVFLGVSLLILLIGIVIASLTGNRMVSTPVVSAATLILGGLIGVLAPTPATRSKSGGQPE